MKRRLFLAMLLLMLLISFPACKIKSTDLPITGKKPNLHYYTNLLAKSLVSDSKSTGIILETNLHKEKELTQEGIDIINGFLKNINSKNFTEKPSDLPEAPQYRIYLNSKNGKYVINVYNERYVSVHPWDGVYSMDFIDMKNISALYNLHGLCKYFFK